MKKTISYLRRASVLVVAWIFSGVMLSGCGAKESKSEATGDHVIAVVPEGFECLNGKWSVMADNTEKSFTFNTDKTGTEVNSADDIRSFKWQKRSDKTVGIVYENDSSNKEWDLTLDCEAETLSFFGLVFKK